MEGFGTWKRPTVVLSQFLSVSVTISGTSRKGWDKVSLSHCGDSGSTESGKGLLCFFALPEKVVECCNEIHTVGELDFLKEAPCEHLSCTSNSKGPTHALCPVGRD